MQLNLSTSMTDTFPIKKSRLENIICFTSVYGLNHIDLKDSFQTWENCIALFCMQEISDILSTVML